MSSRKSLAAGLFVAFLLSMSIAGTLGVPGNVRAAHLATPALFVAPPQRHVADGSAQKVWVHTIALANVTLKLDYGNGQVITLHGKSGDAGTYLFRWTVAYRGTAVTLAHYWVYVQRGDVRTSARGDFVLFPAPPLGVSLIVRTPTVRTGSMMRVDVYARPGAHVTLRVRGPHGRTLLTRTTTMDSSGTWVVTAPISSTATRRERLSVVASGYLLGRRAAASAVVSLRPLRNVALPSGTSGPLPSRSPMSRSQAAKVARAAADGSLSQAQSNAQTAVHDITVDLQVLAQWTSAGGLHAASYYQNLLSNATSYDAYINATAQALSDDALVRSRMHAVMPHRAIMVSLGEQALRAYEDGRLVMFTYITTGRPQLPTVTGHYAIYEKVTPFEFHSPWPPGSPFYYPPTWIKYWMPFYEGYGLHDAWWRAHYGPGTDITGDGPGSSEPTGTHGCVNIPFDKTVWLWNWAPVGTPVVVYGGPSVAAGVAGL